MSTQQDSAARFDELLKRQQQARTPCLNDNATAHRRRSVVGQDNGATVDLDQWKRRYFPKPGEIEWGC